LPDILKEMAVMTDEPASERLFTESAMTATLPEIIPAISLITHSVKLTQIPTMPAVLPAFMRTDGDISPSDGLCGVILTLFEMLLLLLFFIMYTL